MTIQSALIGFVGFFIGLALILWSVGGIGGKRGGGGGENDNTLSGTVTGSYCPHPGNCLTEVLFNTGNNYYPKGAVFTTQSPLSQPEEENTTRTTIGILLGVGVIVVSVILAGVSEAKSVVPSYLIEYLGGLAGKVGEGVGRKVGELGRKTDN